MVNKGAFKVIVYLAMLFLSFTSSSNPINKASAYKDLFTSSLDNKGKISIFSNDNRLLWEMALHEPLISTQINVKKINFDEVNILPGEDGRLYLIHPKSETFKLVNGTIPEIVLQSPIASKYLPNVFFRGKQRTERYRIDLVNGTLSKTATIQSTISPGASLSPSCDSRIDRKSIAFDRIDYILHQIKNHSFTSWNATYSHIAFDDAIQYEDYYAVYYKSDYEILMAYIEEAQFIYKYVQKNQRMIMMSDAMKRNTTHEVLMESNVYKSNSLALYIILVAMSIVSVSFAIYVNTKGDMKEGDIENDDKTPLKRRVVENKSEENISQLSTGSRMTGAIELKKRNSYSYKDLRKSLTMKECRLGKNSHCHKDHNIKGKDKEPYEYCHRESAPEYSIQMKDKEKEIKLREDLNEESIDEEQLSPNKNYLMKPILLTNDKPASAPPVLLTHPNLNDETGLSYDNTINNFIQKRSRHSRETSDSFIYVKKKLRLTNEEKAGLKLLNSKYLRDLQLTSSYSLCKIEQCDSNSKKYFEIYKIINHSVIDESEEAKECSIEDKSLLYAEMIQSASFSQMCDTGRFIGNFDHIQLIGKGGFGSVFKAMHKIDGCYYAIKIIKFSVGIEVDISKINEVQEIKTMMKVEQKNIVRYITCWFEFEDLNLLNKRVRSLSMEDAPIQKSKSKSKGLLNSTTNKNSNNQLCEFELVENEINEGFYCPKAKDYDGIVFGDNSRHIEESNNGNGNGYSMDDNDDYFTSRNSNKNSEIIDIEKQKKQITLSYPVYFYMQMEYCEGFPLSYYLENRTSNLPENLIVYIFKQITGAVEHIHSKKIIHRDLKPANIFIHGQFKVKIGDFGLAAELNQSHKEKVGTALYQSPEQIEGKSYSEKVDVYALGLILIEMCLFFRTESERRTVLMNIRKSIYPEELNVFRNEGVLARRMTQKNPNVRPSITDIINSDEMREMNEII